MQVLLAKHERTGDSLKRRMDHVDTRKRSVRMCAPYKPAECQLTGAPMNRLRTLLNRPGFEGGSNI